MIEYRGLHKSFGGNEVLRGVDLTVSQGETLVLLGPSGTGKSVLLKHTIGLLFPDRGDVTVDGVSILSADAAELRAIRRRVGYVFQNSALFDSYTVLENLWLALSTEERSPRRVEAYRGEATELLERVNLDPEILDVLPGDLSGGMRKRVGVARAIATRPRYLLYDEPTTGLDPVNAENVDRLIIELRRDLGVTGIVVTHDLDSAFQVGDRVALLIDGRIHANGRPEEIKRSTDPVVRRFVRRGRPTAAATVHGASTADGAATVHGASTADGAATVHGEENDG